MNTNINTCYSFLNIDRFYQRWPKIKELWKNIREMSKFIQDPRERHLQEVD